MFVWVNKNSQTHAHTQKLRHNLKPVARTCTKKIYTLLKRCYLLINTDFYPVDYRMITKQPLSSRLCSNIRTCSTHRVTKKNLCREEANREEKNIYMTVVLVALSLIKPFPSSIAIGWRRDDGGGGGGDDGGGGSHYNRSMTKMNASISKKKEVWLWWISVSHMYSIFNELSTHYIWISISYYIYI